VSVALRNDDALHGTIIIFRQEVRPFSDKEIRLLQNFAAQAVSAMENARLLNDLRQRTTDLTESLEQQTATSEVLRVISTSPGELKSVFDAVLLNAMRLCQAKFAMLFLYQGNEFRAVCTRDVPPVWAQWLAKNPIRADPRIPMVRAASTKKPVHVEDARQDVSYLEGLPGMVGLVELSGGRTLLQVPMLKENEVVGMIGIFREEVRAFTDKQIALVEYFAAQAVIAIENARLLNELRQRTADLSESLEQQTGTSEILRVISSSPTNVQPVLDTIVRTAVNLCNSYDAVILLRDGKDLRIATHHGPMALDFERLPLGRDFVSGRSVIDGVPVHVPDFMAASGEFPRGHEVAKRLKQRTVLSLPLRREGQTIGCLFLRRTEVLPFTDKQVQLLTTFADQAVIAIENVRLFEAEQQRTRELARSLDDLRTTQDRLVQTRKLASLGQLTAGIAHEIKNPLNFVNNFSGVSVELIDELQATLRRVTADDKTRGEIVELADTLRDNLNKIVQHGKRADSIVKNMLLHSREGSGEHRPVDINALVEESLNLAYHGARAEKQGFNVTLERSFDPTAGEVDVFPQEITRVLLNVISNGFYAVTKRQGQESGNGFEPAVAAATKNLGDRVEIRIRDNGIGISSDVREKLFSPFFTTKPAGEGTGLGLSISHDIIVKQHGGSIEVETRPSEFTEFRIVLPRKAA
jgi:signal transduction histidine kinase